MPVMSVYLNNLVLKPAAGGRGQGGRAPLSQRPSNHNPDSTLTLAPIAVR